MAYPSPMFSSPAERFGLWCMPCVAGRGAGLGNELIPWARTWLMSQVLGARCLPPAFGLNRRGYHAHFGTWRGDVLLHALMRRGLPRVHFDEAAYREHGAGDVAVAFEDFVRRHRLGERWPLLVTTDGLWGGLVHVLRAREFVRGTLYRSRGAARNLSQLSSRLDPRRLTVALHVRLGDFEASTPHLETYRGRFNLALPLAWYVRVCSTLQDVLGERVQFQVFSDGSPAALAPLVQQIRPVDTSCDHPGDASDMLAMAQADLLVCSVSSYSAWAAALSDAPYVWFAPQMQVHEGGWMSIWGHEPQQTSAGSPTLAACRWMSASTAAGQAIRGHALGMDDSLPAALCSELHARWSQLQRAGDPVFYGVTRPA